LAFAFFSFLNPPVLNEAVYFSAKIDSVHAINCQKIDVNLKEKYLNINDKDSELNLTCIQSKHNAQIFCTNSSFNILTAHIYKTKENCLSNTTIKTVLKN
jgi:hypothetical protein